MSERTETKKFKICDRCGKEALEGVHPDFELYATILGEKLEEMRRDLCPTCLEDFAIWLNTKPDQAPDFSGGEGECPPDKNVLIKKKNVDSLLIKIRALESLRRMDIDKLADVAIELGILVSTLKTYRSSPANKLPVHIAKKLPAVLVKLGLEGVVS